MFCYRAVIINRTKLLNNIFFCSKFNNRNCSTVINKPILYGDLASPTVRFAMMTASIVGIDLDFHKIDLFCGENKSEMYTNINPLQKVPVLSVENEIIQDSHAIALFFCRKSNNTNLYPQEILEKAKVDQMLFFNSGALFPLDSTIYTAYFAGNGSGNEKQVQQWNILLDYLDKKLSKQKWLAGEKMTICDLGCAATVSSLRLLIPPSERHDKVNQWLQKIESLPCSKINKKGLKRLSDFVKKFKCPAKEQ